MTGHREGSVHIDPVCGMEVDEAPDVPTTDYDGRRYYFCCEHCKEQFERNPKQYLDGGR
jgi:YHS domain-containing protein